MVVKIINPHNQYELTEKDQKLYDKEGNFFPIIQGIPRICKEDNYSESFGFQWNNFRETQIDFQDYDLSEKRFFSQTCWKENNLNSQDILEVGSGAGRFSKVVLDKTKANLYSIDSSNAVVANQKNNYKIAPERFFLFQASIYEMPFPNGSFDKIFCFGVLQHTPDFESAIRAIIDKTKPGGEIVVDFYNVKGWWNKVHAKYILRPIAKRLSHKKLMSIIENNIDWMIKLYKFLYKLRLGILTRFLPICDINKALPDKINKNNFREWVILDTFDMFSPQFDNPQKIRDVEKFFTRNNAKVTFAGIVKYENLSAAVVRAVKRGD